MNIYKHKTVRLEQIFSSILSLVCDAELLILVTPSNSIEVIENGS